jgi:chromosome segregation and condensation protein ScpB
MQPSMELQTLHRQMEQLQQSVDTMSIELERVSESQRFQSKLLYENRGAGERLSG